MMGPLPHSQEFSPGKMVIYVNKKILRTETRRIGTVIDNFVDVVLETGNRTEKAYVLWDDGTAEWVPTYLLVPLDF
tara:strand:- start:824 stop:1051 length:228 start_codon:yes stop_codon:yes gene_type:complete